MKKRKWQKQLFSAALSAGITLTMVMSVPASPEQGGTNGGESNRELITEIDFSNRENLDSLPDHWQVQAGSGTASLEDAGEGADGKTLKLSRTADGAEVKLVNDALKIQENEYSYISIETKMKLGAEGYANQWSLPYIKDKSGTIAYTLLVEGDWSQFKSHVGSSSNKQAVGNVVKGQWHDIRMDINLEKDTFRVSVDGAYVLYDENARAKVDNLQNLQFYADSWNRGTVCIQSVKITGQKRRTESAVFYISNAGDDSAAGTSETTAWKTLSRVNQERFIPGDQILFQRGNQWENQTLFPHGSGSEDSYITIASYGDGVMPKISTNAKAQDALCFYNQSYWEISELDISNTAEGFGQTTNDGAAPDYNNAARNNQDGALLGDFRGIHIAGRDERYLKGYHIHDVKVHDVTGEVGWIGNTGLNDAGIRNNMGLDGSKRTGGLLIECLKPSGSTPTQFSDILIEKNEFINNSFAGIMVKQWHGSGDQSSSNPGWDARNNNNGAPDYYSSNWYPHTNIVVQDNLVNQGASAYACNGIYLTSVKDSMIQRNVVEHIGTCGIELYFADNVVIQYNEVTDIIHKGGGQDNNAIDPDWRVSNCLIQYNYIHNAGEGFLLCGMKFNTGIIRYNLVQDCTTSYVHYSMGSGHFQFYNNIFYNSKDGNGTTNFDPWGGGSASYMNNIFYDGRGRNFSFSGGSGFVFDNNAYYGTSPTSKDSNPIILTEDPFVGEAPSMARKGSFASGVLLEANGLQLKEDSILIGAGKTADPKGYTIDEGLKGRGSIFNFTSLAEAVDKYGWDVNIERTSYPVFDKMDYEATFHTEKNQQLAKETTPSIGLFEAEIPADKVILRGQVTDGLNPVAGAQVKVETADGTVNAVTDEHGNYSITNNLKVGEAKVTISCGNHEDQVETVTLEGGKITVLNFALPLPEMPGKLDNDLINENFDSQTEPENFGFDRGAEIADGKLIITKAGTMGNAATAVMKFSPEISKQKAIDLTFDYLCTSGNKQGLEFRDSYGRLIFAICAAADKNELRPSITGGTVDDLRVSSTAEPAWITLAMNKSTTYKIQLHVDFENQEVSYSVAEADGTVVAQEVGVHTDAVNLAKFLACSWWDSKSQYIDNFVLTGSEAAPFMPHQESVIYAFGDSLVYGHKYKYSFVDYVAMAEGMKLNKYAFNGATIMDAPGYDGQILTQVNNASNEQPDFIIFDGGVNDAEYLVKNAGAEYGSVSDSKDPASFDTETFAGAFEQTICEMKDKWPDAQIIYVAAHKLGSRDWEAQQKIRELTMDICMKWEVAVADVFADAQLDTREEEQKNRYTFNDLGGNGLPGTNGSGTHPNLAAIEECYVPIVSDTLNAPQPYRADKKKLNELITSAEAEAAKSDIYSAEDIEKLELIIVEAKKVADDETAIQSKVNAQAEILEQAIAEIRLTETTYYTTGIKVTRKPDQMTYEVGDDFAATGMKVIAYETASASNAASRERELSEDEYSVSYDFETPGPAEVVVSYSALNAMGTEEEFTDSFEVYVSEDIAGEYYTTSIKVTRKPNKTVYEVDEDFEPAGMKVVAYQTATASNATPSNVGAIERVLEEDEYEVEYDFSEPGTSEVTVIYLGRNAEEEEQEFKASFTVKVIEALEGDYYTTRIKVLRKPDKLEYQLGETLDPSGMNVVAYETASPSNATPRQRVLTEDDYELDYDFDRSGIRKVTVIYYAENKQGEETAFKDWFQVTVTDRNEERIVLERIEITREPDKTTYYYGETLDLAGLEVTARYSDGSSKQIDAHTVDKVRFTTYGKQQIPVSYEGKSAVFEVEVIRRSSSSGGDTRTVVSGPASAVIIDGLNPAITIGEGISAGTWKQDGKGWWFDLAKDGYPKNQWAQIDGKWYLFDKTGYMLSGWIQNSGTWFMLREDGLMYENTWVMSGGKWYHFREDGSMRRNEWLEYHGYWYYLGNDGAMMAGGKTLDGYLLDRQGRWIS